MATEAAKNVIVKDSLITNANLLALVDAGETALHSHAGGGGGATITNRDTAVADWAVGDLTTNGAWHDLDISGEVPANCTECWVKVFFGDDSANLTFGVREDGLTGVNAGFFIRNPVANQTHVNTLGPVKVVSQVIEYYASNTTITTLDVTIVAYRVG